MPVAARRTPRDPWFELVRPLLSSLPGDYDLMAGVGRSTEGYQQFTRDIAELEDDYREQAKRNKEAREDEATRLKAAYQKTLESEREEHQDTISSVKDNYQKSIDRDREANRLEAERQKKITYDRLGRMKGGSAEVLQQQNEALQKDLEARKQEYQDKVSKTQDYYDQRASQLAERHNRELEAHQEEVRNQVQEHGARESEAHRAEHVKEQERLREKYDKLNHQNAEGGSKDLKRAVDAVEAARLEAERREKKQNDQTDMRMRRTLQGAELRNQEDQRALKESHLKELRELEDRVDEMARTEGSHTKGYNEGKAQAIYDYENEWNQKVQQADSDYRFNLEKLKEDSAEKDQIHSKKSNERLREVEQKFTTKIAEMNLDHHEREKEIQEHFDRGSDQLKLQVKHEQESTDRRLERQMQLSQETRDRALGEQAQAFQKAMRDQAQISGDQLKLAEKRLHESETSIDTNHISPAAEEAVRRTTIGEYGKLLDEEQSRNRRAEGRILENSDYNYNMLREEKLASETKLNQQASSEQSKLRREFASVVEEANSQQDTVVREAADSHDRQINAMLKEHSRILEKQRRQYDELFETMKRDADSRIDEIRQQSEFRSRLMTRQAASEQGALIRDYEKKIEDQREQYEALLSEMQSQSDKKARDDEKRKQAELETHLKNQEFQLAQLEQQHRERERNIQQNFEEEIDKVKRANARIIRQRS